MLRPRKEPPVRPHHLRGHSAWSVPGVALYPVTHALLLATLLFACHMPPVIDRQTVAAALIAASVGIVIGLICSPIVKLLLHGRDPRHAKPIVLWIAALVAVGTTIVWDDGSFVPTIVVVVAYLFATLMARGFAPRVWTNAVQCRHCGYDIRGSLAFSRCPECGLGFSADSYSDFMTRDLKHRTGVGRAGRFLLRRPAIPLLVWIGTLVMFALGATLKHDHRERVIADAIASAIEKRSSLNLSQIADFEWDEVYVFAAYADLTSARRTIPFDLHTGRPDHKRAPSYLILFALDDEYVESVATRYTRSYTAMHERTDFDGFAIGLGALPIPRQEAVFHVQVTEGDKWDRVAFSLRE